ncbi:hypothetical protein [Lentzea sp. NPDC003310]|uniref:hypothetical protein n=1 Tax=Lentzea sp. NPDC003310 TaxID=3154447 RepID=UPI0033B01FF9
MTPDEVRAALEGWRDITETEALGGVVFEWAGDPLVGVVDGALVVRAEGGWATATGPLDEALDRSAGVVIDECVVRWHGELRAGGLPAFQAMLALVRHDPEREQLQRVLLDVVDHGPDRDLAQLAVTCLGHVGRIDRAVLPEVVPRLRALLGDPQLGGRAEDALGDIESFAGR